MKKLKTSRSCALTFVIAAALTVNLMAQGGFIVDPGTNVTLATGSTIDITDGDLLLRDDLSSAPSFLQKGTLNFTNSGDAKVEQYLTKDVWHIVSPPVNNEVNAAYIWIYLYSFTETTWSWLVMNQPTNQALNPGQGYFAWAYSDDPNGGGYPTSPDSVVMNGILNAQDIDLNLTVTDASPKSGWNLMGNPFPCGLDWNGNADWNLTNLDASIWIWDPASGNHKVWNYNSGGTLNSGEIAATQGFWVHANDTTGATATSMTLPASQRLHSTEAFYKSSGPISPNQLKLKVQGNTPENDECVIGFMEGASSVFNSAYDAKYLEGSETAPSLSVAFFGSNYAMKQLPGWEKFNVVPLDFKTTVPGIYTISASWIESFPENLPVYLEDKKEGCFHDLRQWPVYNFISELNDNTQRFMLHFSTPLGMSGTDNMQQMNIFSWQKMVYINMPADYLNGASCTIFDMMGQKVLSTEIGPGFNTLPITHNQGYYVVTLNMEGRVITEKVFIE